MYCPFCGHIETKVIDSRLAGEGRQIRRRRECLACARRFTTYERIEEAPLLIRKRSGATEPFDELITDLKASLAVLETGGAMPAAAGSGGAASPGSGPGWWCACWCTCCPRAWARRRG